ncbi:hypothetical protein DWG96_22665 [Escherichia coli]|nr:hypothetical protein [Escherichia coli]
MTLTRKELSITDAKNDNLFYLINATCHKFTGKADHLILLQNTKVVKIAVGSLRLKAPGDCSINQPRALL